MAAAYASSASDVTTATSDTSLDITAPTGITVGDVLIAVIGCTDARSVTAPTGWATEINSSDGTQRLFVFSKVATSGDAAASTFTFTISGTFNNASGALYRLTSASTTGIVTAFATGTNSQSLTCPNITTTANGAEILWGAYQPSAAGPATIARGIEVVDQSNSTSGTWIYGAHEDIATAGAQTGPTITKTGFGAGRAYAVAVNASSGGGGFTAIRRRTLGPRVGSRQ